MNSLESHELSRKLAERFKSEPGYENLVALIDTLLGENGCPWDRERVLSDCPKYLRDELDEVVAAIESGDNENLEEELGDLVFMVIFTIRIAEKSGQVNLDGVFRRIIDKMVYRHPHVFGGEMAADNPDQVVSNWKELKEREKNSAD